MEMSKSRMYLPVVLALLVAGGCRDRTLTLEEALQALEEVALSGQAETASGGTIEIATSFTIGAAVEAAAEELKEFIESQLPCAEITLHGAKLTVEYGVNPGICTWHGQTYEGTHVIEIVSAADGQLVVRHEWIEMANQRVSVSGEAEVTWSSAAGSRHVEHELHWTRLADGFAVTGSGQRTQTAHPDGLATGLRVEGGRSWTSDRGYWRLEIDGVQLRWADPVPESGAYELLTPFEGPAGERKTVTMSFQRIDQDTIRVTVESGDKSFSFDVSRLGVITEAEDE